MYIPTGITFEQAKAAITYIPATGKMIWALPRGRMKGGSKVGTVMKGETWVRLAKKLVRGSDVAYYWMNGTWKRTYCLNGDKSDLRWSNIAVLPDEVLPVAVDKPYTYLRQEGDSWVISGNMGVTIDQMMTLLEIND